MDALGPEDPAYISGYRLLGLLGEGGMGRVYLGSDDRDRRVTIKVIHSRYARSAEFRRRFSREVGAAQRVFGVGILPVLAADPEGDRPWLATPYVAGITLSDAVEIHGRLPLVSCWRLAGLLVPALEAIHSAGVVHRDLKPSNVILAADRPYVIDFGIARADDDSVITRTGDLVGTPGYMAPELLAGERGDERVDLFALGAVLAFAACGRHPFTAGQGPVAFRPLKENPNLSGIGDQDLMLLIQHCLAKDPLRRPPLVAVAREAGTRREAEPWLPEQLMRAISGRGQEFTARHSRGPVPTVVDRPHEEPPPTVTTSHDLDGTQQDASAMHMHYARGHAAYSTERYGESLAEFHIAAAGMRRSLGEDNLYTLNARCGVADSLYATHSYTAARKEYEKLLPDHLRILGAEHERTLAVHGGLASSLYATGHYLEALTETKALLSTRIRVLGKSHPRTLESHQSLGVTLAALGNVTQAEVELRAVLKLRRRVFGRKHPRTLETQQALASLTAR